MKKIGDRLDRMLKLWICCIHCGKLFRRKDNNHKFCTPKCQDADARRKSGVLRAASSPLAPV